jgi:hypothetical protein
VTGTVVGTSTAGAGIVVDPVLDVTGTEFAPGRESPILAVGLVGVALVGTLGAVPALGRFGVTPVPDGPDGTGVDGETTGGKSSPSGELSSVVPVPELVRPTSSSSEVVAVGADGAPTSEESSS